jgi:transposase
VQQDSNHCSGYAPIGVASRMLNYAETSSHRVCSILSAVSTDGEMINTVETEICDAEAFLIFLKEIHKKVKGKIFLIVDNARIHHAKKVKEYIESQRKISLFYLPAYAPDINPVELFNNAFKINIRKSNAMKSEELISYVYKLLENMRNDVELMKSFFKSKKVQYLNVA